MSILLFTIKKKFLMLWFCLTRFFFWKYLFYKYRRTRTQRTVVPAVECNRTQNFIRYQRNFLTNQTRQYLIKVIHMKWYMIPFSKERQELILFCNFFIKKKKSALVVIHCSIAKFGVQKFIVKISNKSLLVIISDVN